MSKKCFTLISIFLVLGFAGRVSATTFYCDPTTGSMSNDGSSGSPWSTLQAVFDNNKIESRDKNLNTINSGAPVKAGDTIMLRSGNHGSINETGGYHNTSTITIEAQSGHTPKLKSWVFDYASNWVIRGLEFAYGMGGGHIIDILSGSSGIATHDITIEDCYIYTQEDSSGWTTTEWNNVPYAVYLYGSGNVILQDCTIKNIDMGVVATSNTQVIGCSIQNFTKDGIRGSGSYITLEENEILDSYAVNANHDDGIQWYSGPDAHVYDCIMRGNLIMNDTSGGTRSYISLLQGIGCFDDYLHNFTVENNVVICEHYHGITLNNGINSKCANNTAYNPGYLAGENDRKTWIHFSGDSSNNILINNLDHETASGSDMQVTPTNYTQFFVSTDRSNLDLHLKAGSPAIDAGTSSGAPSVDFDGVSRPQGSGYDVGAYEYVTSGAPGQATNPSPSNGATSVSTTADLSWTAGSGATSHDVYFGTDSTPDSGEFQGNQTSTTFDPGTMSSSTTYYWRIDEKNASGTTTGTVWNFTTEGAPDTTPPSPDPMTWATEPYATGSSSISMTATTATDTSGVEYYFDETTGNPGGSDSGWQDSATYQDAGLSASTQYTYRVKARDKSSNNNETAYSTTRSATTGSSTAVTSTASWQNFVIDTQTGSFTFEFDATANNNNIDVCISTVNGVASTWDHMANTTRFNPSGYIDARNGGSYAADTSVAYSSGNTYHVRMEIDVPTHTYDVYVTPPGQSEVTLATNYAFRTSQQSVTSLDHWALIHTVASATIDNVEVTAGGGGDTTAPSPDPMTWATDPYATGTTSISMTATTATDASGVEYFFDCTTAGGHDSIWQDSTSYTDTGLSPSTQYSYQVKARDKSSNQNETAYSTLKSATTQAPPDTTPPSPDPMTWATEPYATGTSSISMTATTATDVSGVEYYFECTAGGGHSSGWQDSTTYQDTGLSELTQYTYRVKARDKSSNQNETAYSTTKSATTQDGTAPSPNPMTWATEPYATGLSSISMIATTATDASGVEYYFECTAGGGNSSSWQDSTTYEDTGLSESTQYTYRVKARDKSSNQNETAYSTTKSATTQDGTAPTPDPMTWATEPYATGASSVSMTATTGTDASGVEYYFECTAGGGNSSSWQDSATYQDTGLSASTQYSYRVKARDKSSNNNETAYSTVKSATTQTAGGPTPTGWWKLDETSGTTAADSSGNSYDGTVTGASWTSSGYIDGGISFNATSGQRVEVPTSGMSASAGTISLWGKVSSTTNVRYFFGHTSNPVGWADRIQLYMSDGDTQLDLGFGGSHTTATNIATLSTGTWYHIALTWDNGDYVVYVDGVSKASGTYTGLSTLGSIADIGNNNNSSDRTEPFNGVIDDVRIYDQALDADEVNDIYEGVTEIATSPNPADQATGVATTAVLSWTPGDYAASHDVYLGTDYNSVADANYSSSEYKGNFDTNSFDPNGLGSSTTYYWAVDEVNGTSLWLGDIWSFTTEAAPDTTAPSPDPMTWATEPYATGSTSISMTATTATDASGVEYYFECTAGGGNSSSWQDSTTYEDTGLSPSTQYSYRVKARDKSSNQNETAYSTTKSATTESGSDPNLEAWWKFDETSGTSASDSSGNSHTGTLQNGASFTSGYLNNAVNFDGSDDRAACGTWNVTGSAITICCWFKADTFTGSYYDGRIVSKTTSTAEADHTWMLSGIKEGTSNKRLRFRLKTGGTTSTLIATSGNLSTGTWYHGAAVYNGSTMKLYLDGDEVGSTSKSGSITTSSAGIAVGHNPADAGNTPWDGLIDDVRIYDRALSQSEFEDLAGE